MAVQCFPIRCRRRSKPEHGHRSPSVRLMRRRSRSTSLLPRRFRSSSRAGALLGRRLRRRLQEDGAAGRDRRGELVHHQVQRKVERRDRADDAAREAPREAQSVGRGRRGVERQDLPAERHLGRSTRCPKCGTRFTLSAPGPPAGPVPATAIGFGLGYGAYDYGYGYPYYGYDDGYYGCYVVQQRVMTPYGWSFRPVQVCN